MCRCINRQLIWELDDLKALERKKINWLCNQQAVTKAHKFLLWLGFFINVFLTFRSVRCDSFYRLIRSRPRINIVSSLTTPHYVTSRLNLQRCHKKPHGTTQSNHRSARRHQMIKSELEAPYLRDAHTMTHFTAWQHGAHAGHQPFWWRRL